MDKEKDWSFVDTSTVELVNSMGSDEGIVRAMLVSTRNDQRELTKEGVTGRIRSLLKNGHTSPFEHAEASFRIECPVFVARQIFRHRTANFNEASARYSEVPSKFYVPSVENMRTQVGSNMSYRYESMDPEIGFSIQNSIKLMSIALHREYQSLLEKGLAREVARMILPQNVFTAFYMKNDLHNWLHFLKLRLHDTAQLETRDVANQIYEHLTKLFPITMEVYFNETLKKV